MYLELGIFRIQYSTERSCAAIGDISTVQCALHCKLSAKYSAQPPIYAIRTVVPDIYNGITVPHIQASIFNWTYLRCYWRYAAISMGIIVQIGSQMQRISSCLRYVNCGPRHIQCKYSFAYSGFNIQLNVSVLLLLVYQHIDGKIL
jgi:hypothetical protein